MGSNAAPPTLQRVTVELDVTPDFWTQGAKAIGAAVAAVINAYPLGEVRVTRKRIVVRAMFPDTAMPTASQVEAVRLHLRNVAREAMQAAT